jgi:hypothetical protein
MSARDYAHRWLLLVPFLWQVGAVPLVNDIAWRPFALPFPMAWQLAGIIVTSLVIGLVFRLDRRAERRAGLDENGDGPGIEA